MANSEDPDQTPHFAASDLGLHCLLMSLYPHIKGKECTLLFRLLFHYRFNNMWVHLSLVLCLVTISYAQPKKKDPSKYSNLVRTIVPNRGLSQRITERKTEWQAG